MRCRWSRRQEKIHTGQRIRPTSLAGFFKVVRFTLRDSYRIEEVWIFFSPPCRAHRFLEEALGNPQGLWAVVEQDWNVADYKILMSLPTTQAGASLEERSSMPRAGEEFQQVGIDSHSSFCRVLF